MSLIVYPYVRHPVTDRLEKPEEQPGEAFNDLFGFESWRHHVWAGEAVKSLGCELLPTLAESDIYAEDIWLDVLAHELKTIRHNLPTVAESNDPDEMSGIEFRVNNALEAVRIARLYEQGGVYIG